MQYQSIQRGLFTIAFPLVLGFFFGSQICKAETELLSRDTNDVVRFLAENIMERTFHLGKTKVLLDNERIEAEGQVSIHYANLTKTRRGWYFDRCTNRQQTNYDLDEAGQRTGEKTERNFESVTRCYFSERRSTGRVTGYIADVYTDSDMPYFAGTLQLHKNGEKLVLITTNGLYGDSYAVKGNFRPGGGVVVDTFSVEPDGTKCVNREQSYEIDAGSVAEYAETPWLMKRTAKQPLPEMIYWAKKDSP
jgi:hypothetical protein